MECKRFRIKELRSGRVGHSLQGEVRGKTALLRVQPVPQAGGVGWGVPFPPLQGNTRSLGRGEGLALPPLQTGLGPRVHREVAKSVCDSVLPRSGRKHKKLHLQLVAWRSRMGGRLHSDSRTQ